MGKKSKRKTRWRSLPIGDASSQNEEDVEEGGEENGVNTETQQNGHYRKYRPNNGYRYQHHHGGQKYSTTQTVPQVGEKIIFNEDEYTKITTPRQDVLFKKGYLGRRRPIPTPDTSLGDLTNGDHVVENGESQDNQSEASSETVTSLDQPPIIYTNGYVDPHGGPIFYLNGTYDMYEPYSGVYSSFMVPAAPGYPNGVPGGPGSMLAAVPCQPLPLQPLEWFNPRCPQDMGGGGGWCFVAPCPPAPLPPPHMTHMNYSHRKKRYSTDSQNCSPHSSESTGPPGSPQHEEMEMEMMPADMYSQPPPPTYVYPGYMFGPAVYNVNGVAVPGPPPAPINGSLPEHLNGISQLNGVNGVAVDAATVSAAAQAKRRKKKRRRKRRRGFRGEGAGTDEGSEESSSEEGLDEKDGIEETCVLTSRTNGISEAVMSSSSPGSGSAPASLPPATSESCSELSAASSPHNSHDETEPSATAVPVRPSRKHVHDTPKQEPQSPSPQPQEAAEPSVVESVDTKFTEISTLHSNTEVLKESLEEQERTDSSTEDIVVVVKGTISFGKRPELEQEIATQIETVVEIPVKQELQVVAQEEEIVAESSIIIATQPAIEFASVIDNIAALESTTPEEEKCVEIQQAEVPKIVTTPATNQHEEKVSHKNGGKISRKGSRKSKHHHHHQQQQQPQSQTSSDENIADIRPMAVAPESPTLERPASSLSVLSIRETEDGSSSPIPPPRRRGKAKHRPPTPCNLPSDQETLAQDLSEQIINDAVVEAIRQCSITETECTEVVKPTAATVIQRPITEAVTNWLQTNPDPLITLNDISDEEEDDDNITGSKNGIVNPLPAPSNSFINVSRDGQEKRVEKNASLVESLIINNNNKMQSNHHHHRMNSSSSMVSSDEFSGEWDSWDDPSSHSNTTNNENNPSKKTTLVHHHQKNTTTTAAATGEEEEEIESLPSSKYDPAVSVAKYYQLTHDPVIKLKPQEAWLSANEVISDSGIESGDEPQSPKINFNERSIKFVRHLQGGFPDTEPFPCGACCNIQ